MLLEIIQFPFQQSQSRLMPGNDLVEYEDASGGARGHMPLTIYYYGLRI